MALSVGKQGTALKTISQKLLYGQMSIYLSIYMLSLSSSVWLFVTLWAVACQAPLFMGFSRQESWSGLPCPAPKESSWPRDQTWAFCYPALTGRFFATSAN